MNGCRRVGSRKAGFLPRSTRSALLSISTCTFAFPQVAAWREQLSGKKRYGRDVDLEGNDARLDDPDLSANDRRFPRLHCHEGYRARSGHDADPGTIATSCRAGSKCGSRIAGNAAGAAADRGSARPACCADRDVSRSVARADPNGFDLSARSGGGLALG